MGPESTDAGALAAPLDLVGVKEILCMRFSEECLVETWGTLSQNCS